MRLASVAKPVIGAVVYLALCACAPDAGSNDAAQAGQGDAMAAGKRADANAAPRVGGVRASATARAGDSAETALSGAFAVEETTELYEFEYAWPEAAGDEPGLRALLDRRRQNSLELLQENATRGRADARDSGFPYNRYLLRVNWEIVADLPDYLSLSARRSSYTGGAHGNYGFNSLIWDRKSRTALKPESFFSDMAALEDAVREPFCTGLQEERARRRADVDAEDIADDFRQCPPLKDMTILLGSSSGRRFNRLGLLAGPYVAGPFSEGAYEIDVPITAAILEAVDPRYRDAFALR